MKGINILVTGGAGFIGSHLVDGLVAAGHNVRVLDSLVDQVHGGVAPRHLNKDAEFIHGDLRDRTAVERALDGIDAVYHQAAEVGIAQSMYEISRYVDGNDLGTAILLEEIVKRRERIRKLVVASSHSVYGEGAYRCEACDVVSYPALRSPEQMAAHRWEFSCLNCGGELHWTNTPENKPIAPTSIYAITKFDQEQFCLAIGRAYQVPTVAFRYFNVYGTRQALSNPYTGVCAIFSARLLNDQAPSVFEDGEQTRDFIHVSDVVRANVLALDREDANYEVINLGTGEATSIRRIAELLAKGLGRDIEPEIPMKYREGDIRHCIADIAKARRLLGFEPAVGLEDGLSSLLDWIRTQNAEDRVAAATAELAQRSLVK